MQFLRNRYYDSRTGTFLTQDPIGVAGGVNLYGYVGNNPLNFVDPNGFFGQRTREAFDWYAYESALPGPFGAPTSEWQSSYYNWGDPLKYTEAAGGAWMWGERIALGVATTATVAALTVGGFEAIALNNQSINLGYKGGEIFLKVANEKPFFRLNPLGDWNSGNQKARRPHYHRRPISRPADPGEGIKWHRPWEKGF